MNDLNRLCIHTFTNKPWSLAEATSHYAKAGLGGISVWQNVVEPIGVKEAAKILNDSGLDVVSYVRGGFFPSTSAQKRAEAIDHNKKMIEEAAEIGAPLLVLVCGAEPDQSLEVSRMQITEGIEALIPFADAHQVKLGIEPLHPMYADTRSAINSLFSANEIAEQINHDRVGVVIDLYHLWWEPNLKGEILRCGQKNNIFAFHTCDWAVPTDHMLTDRELMGQGCIRTKEIRKWVEEAGFVGPIEVEIFSEKYWAMDQAVYLDLIIKAYLEHA